MTEKILIIGACGQLGTEITLALRKIYTNDQIIAADIVNPVSSLTDGPFETINAMDKNNLAAIVRKHHITQVYHLAAILSAKGEQDPMFAWELNMNSLLNVLELARNGFIHKIYWPSSIAVFGPSTPRNLTPQHTIMDPNTIYGISKLAGERLCDYYFQKYHVDVRSLRYPGIISYKTAPGGGTTDYAIDIFFKAIKNEPYTCFLREDTRLPMMYIDDAVRATLEIMQSPSEKIKIRSSYNLAAISFTPSELFLTIKNHIPNFSISFKPDFRQNIADSWPQSIQDTDARKDWGWAYQYDIERMSKEMIAGLASNIKN